MSTPEEIGAATAVVEKHFDHLAVTLAGYRGSMPTVMMSALDSLLKHVKHATTEDLHAVLDQSYTAVAWAPTLAPLKVVDGAAPSSDVILKRRKELGIDT